MDATPVEETVPPPPVSPVKPPARAVADAATTFETTASPGPDVGFATGTKPTETTSESEKPMSTVAATAPDAPTHAPSAFAMATGANDAQDAAPPTVNAAAAASAAALMTSSAMTPTTTNYGMNAQLIKSTGTLTPMGEDKVSTAGPNTTKKAKQTKKKAPAAEGETAKKPSPRVRTKADPAKSRKASPARSSGSSTTPTSVPGTVSAPDTTAPTASTPPPAPPNQQYPTISENAPTAPQHELPPSQDTELRKQYLQRIYRQLQMTHRNQDDTVVRRLATSIEIDICRRVATRAEYVNLMNQQIHSLMQAELANGTVGLQSSLYVPGVGMPPSSNAPTVPVSNANGMTQSALQQASAAAYKQGQTPVSAGVDVTQRASTPSQGSFMSLLSGQSPMQSYEAARAPQQYGAQALPAQGRHPQFGAAAPGYTAQAQGMPQSSGMKSDPQSELTSQQAYPGQRMPAQPSLTSAPPDFVAQFQRLDRNGLVDLLWTQHKTVIQYQRRLAQLEVQLNARQNPGVVGPTTNMPPTSAGIPSGYYNASPRQTSSVVPPNVSAEAEAQRARDRATSRATHQPGQYGQPQYPPSQPPTTPQGVVNPHLYWEKVRYLSESYLRPLYVAHQALSQHSAPANSAQGAKAENVKHNIALACSILSETPSGVQPRPLEVLESIERFIQSTVVPIVRKVSPHNLGPSPPGAPQQMRSQNLAELNDPSRNAMSVPAVSQALPTSTTSGINLPNGSQPPVTAPTTPAAPTKAAAKTSSSKGGAKAAGKKSPSNGSKKATTPKAAAPKNTKAAGKKSPGKSAGAKQTAAAKAVNTPSELTSTSASVQIAAAPAPAVPLPDNVSKDRSEMAPIKTGGMTDDDLNDFSDFADLDFDDDLQDPLVKVSSNKENATGVNARKRSIEDV